jgi:hypothetical protein
MTEEQMVSKGARKGQDELCADKRVFLQRAAAALGVAAAAGLTGAAITKSARKVGSEQALARFAKEDLRQQQIMAGKKLIILTQEEKRQMLDRILSNHSRTVS